MRAGLRRNTKSGKERSDILRNYTYPSTMGTTIVLDKGSIKQLQKSFLHHQWPRAKLWQEARMTDLNNVTLTFNAMSEDPRWDITCS